MEPDLLLPRAADTVAGIVVTAGAKAGVSLSFLPLSSDACPLMSMDTPCSESLESLSLDDDRSSSPSSSSCCS